MEKKKALFIDRDGTILVEPPLDFQVDHIDKLDFLPGAISGLASLARCGNYKLVMVTNQDGLGTASFPEDRFRPLQALMKRVLASEGILFEEILIDRSMPADNAPTRKPGTAMLSKYLEGSYDLASSWVIGDRITDVELAVNLGAKAILVRDKKEGKRILRPDLEDTCRMITRDWSAIAAYLTGISRSVSLARETRETRVTVELLPDGQGVADIETGIGFFDHLLELLACHSGFNLRVRTEGDLHVDEHHSIEDTALVLGEALHKALGSKRGIERYGFALPMDESMAEVLLDFGGRSWLIWDAEFRREKIGEMPTEMFYHFFRSLADMARCNLFVRAEGENDHHKIEAVIKAFARALKMAVKREPLSGVLPSTKNLI